MAPEDPVKVVDPPFAYQTPFIEPALLNAEPLTTESPDWLKTPSLVKVQPDAPGLMRGSANVPLEIP
jgi:hypothetical protein